MLIKCENGDLYRKWIAYLCKKYNVENSDASIRTTAFFNSQQNVAIPLYY